MRSTLAFAALAGFSALVAAQDNDGCSTKVEQNLSTTYTRTICPTTTMNESPAEETQEPDAADAAASAISAYLITVSADPALFTNAAATSYYRAVVSAFEAVADGSADPGLLSSVIVNAAPTGLAAVANSVESVIEGLQTSYGGMLSGMPSVTAMATGMATGSGGMSRMTSVKSSAMGSASGASASSSSSSTSTSSSHSGSMPTAAVGLAGALGAGFLGAVLAL